MIRAKSAILFEHLQIMKKSCKYKIALKIGQAKFLQKRKVAEHLKTNDWVFKQDKNV